MSLLRPFVASDLFSFNAINLDAWTETYGVSYYLGYLNNWGELFSVVESASGRLDSKTQGAGLMGYVMGKTEGRQTDWHTHVSAITVSPGHRRLGLASMMMDLLEKVGEVEKTYFVDLFVRQSNTQAVSLYESLGYVIFRRVKEYYGAASTKELAEDAYDMRKPLSRDLDGASIKLPKGKRDGRDVICHPEDCYF